MKKFLISIWTNKIILEPFLLFLSLVGGFFVSQPIHQFTTLEINPLYSYPFMVSGFVLWALFYSYHYTYFRYIYYFVSKLLGYLAQIFNRPWLILFFVSGITLFFYDYAMKLSVSSASKSMPLYEIIHYNFLLKVLAMGAILLVIQEGIKARNRIFIADITNFIGEESLKNTISGIPFRLASDLSSIHNLYKIIENSRTVKTKGNAIEATLSIEDLGQSLKEAIGGGSQEIVIGPIKIPFSSIVGILSKLVQGPRLTGSISKEGEDIVLIANLKGGGFSGSWRVNTFDLEDVPTNKEELVFAMCEQLAYRIFTDLTDSGSKRWRAIRSYTEGLRFLRDTLHSSKSKKVNLYKAEKKFIQTLAVDSHFSICHYNLGIVYRRLKKIESAESSFKRAIQLNSSLIDAYYALALISWDMEDYKQTILYCDQILSIDPFDSRAWDLKGMADQKFLLSIYRDKEIAIGSLRANQSMFQLAVLCSWFYLCKDQLYSNPNKIKVDITISCLRNLAKSKESIRVLNQALFFTPEDSRIYADYGTLLYKSKKWKKSLAAFEQAISIDDVDWYYAYMASIYSKLYMDSKKLEYKESCLELSKLALEGISNVDFKAIELTIESMKNIQENSIANSIGEVPVILALLKEEPESIAEKQRYILKLRRKIKEMKIAYDSLPDTDKASHSFLYNWFVARILFQLGQIHFDFAMVYYENEWAEKSTKRLNVASNYYAETIRLLEGEHPKEIKILKCYRAYSYCFYYKDDFTNALLYAEKSLSSSNESSKDRMLLGKIYMALNDTERAKSEFSTSFDLEPTPETLSRISFIYYQTANTTIDPEVRKASVVKGIEFNKEALELLESDSLELTESQNQLEERAKLQQFLGWLYFLNHNYDKAITHLTISYYIDPYMYESKILLGQIYIFIGSYNEAEQTLKSVLLYFQREIKNPNEKEEIFLFRARIFLAYSYIERKINIQKAYRLIKFTKYSYYLLPSEERAIYHDIYGWYLLQENPATNLDQAIAELEKSSRLEYDTLSNYHLSFAYYLKYKKAMAETENTTGKSSEEWLELSKKFYNYAIKTDIFNNFTSKIEALSKLPGIL